MQKNTFLSTVFFLASLGFGYDNLCEELYNLKDENNFNQEDVNFLVNYCKQNLKDSTADLSSIIPVVQNTPNDPFEEIRCDFTLAENGGFLDKTDWFANPSTFFDSTQNNADENIGYIVSNTWPKTIFATGFRGKGVASQSSSLLVHLESNKKNNTHWVSSYEHPMEAIANASIENIKVFMYKVVPGETPGYYSYLDVKSLLDVVNRSKKTTEMVVYKHIPTENVVGVCALDKISFEQGEKYIENFESDKWIDYWNSRSGHSTD